MDTDDYILQQCNTCHEFKRLGEYYAITGPSKRYYLHGVVYKCKKCKKKEYRHKNPIHPKRCRVCGVLFSPLYVMEACSKGCSKVLRLASNRKHNNTDKAKKWKKEYRKRPDVAEKNRVRTRIYKHSNPEKAAEHSKEYCRKRWERAAKSSDGTVNKKVISRMVNEKLCAYCLAPITRETLHLDHVTPLASGGIHSVDNMVTSCSACNMSKGANKLWQYLYKLYDIQAFNTKGTPEL